MNDKLASVTVPAPTTPETERVDLNFRVEKGFRKRFKQAGLNRDITQTDLLKRIYDFYVKHAPHPKKE